MVVGVSFVCAPCLDYLRLALIRGWFALCRKDEYDGVRRDKAAVRQLLAVHSPRTRRDARQGDACVTMSDANDTLKCVLPLLGARHLSRKPDEKDRRPLLKRWKGWKRLLISIIFAFVLANVVCGAVLGTIYERAPVRIMGQLRSALGSDLVRGDVVDVLVPCFSTPLLSALHPAGSGIVTERLECGVEEIAVPVVDDKAQEYDDDQTFVAPSLTTTDGSQAGQYGPAFNEYERYAHDPSAFWRAGTVRLRRKHKSC